ncbi:CLUMA_CG013623, isoform A [Clunio marinus]|uniref:CLUMA_CG013623, isoform A n=1 Tax=Clunio marinus TaxID=568069 RepID=A0A1J1IMN2_9DIPT|nr:CLUMA_CG013623, isoform A [Clunio marinus]
MTMYTSESSSESYDEVLRTFIEFEELKRIQEESRKIDYSGAQDVEKENDHKYKIFLLVLVIGGWTFVMIIKGLLYIVRSGPSESTVVEIRPCSTTRRTENHHASYPIDIPCSQSQSNVNSSESTSSQPLTSNRTPVLVSATHSNSGTNQERTPLVLVEDSPPTYEECMKNRLAQ